MAFFQYLILFLGTASAFWGVLFAMQEQDLKSLLAYSSIENIGLILMGIGVCLYCRNSGEPLAAAIALAAAIFHCINHGLFKSLLFLGAGSIGSGVGSKDLGLLGGLSRNMPWTTACFLLGSAAICALPPLNGFASKWLLYQGLFGLCWGSNSVVNRAAALACIGTLALVGGLSVAVFTKAVGISCLGRARSHSAENAKEGSFGMVAAQLLLAICCLSCGIFVPQILVALQGICSQAAGSEVYITQAFTIPQATLTGALLITVLCIYMLVLRGSSTRKYRTWECGFGDLSTRTEATGVSFAQPIESIFHSVLQSKYELKLLGKDRRHFPERIKVEITTRAWLEMALYVPIINFVRWLAQRFVTIQAGSIHIYLMYMLITLILLVSVGIKL